MSDNTKILIGIVAALAVVAALLAIILLGLPGDDESSVTGAIVYRERMALPDDAVVRVAIVDTTSGQPLSSQFIPDPGQPPIPYEVPYDASQVNESLAYVVDATIEDSGGNPLFVTRQNFPVITQGNPTRDVEVLVETAGAAPPASIFITIGEPVQGAIVDISQPVRVSGQGGGLPEGNVVVQALDRDGTVLAEQATIVDAPDAGTGGQGPWAVELNIDTEPGMAGRIRAFSPSPADNSILAEAQISVLFGAPAEEVPPTAVINGPGQAVAGNKVSFDGSGSQPGNSGNIVRYDWGFGDGATASGPVAEHTYGIAGSYNVTLIVTDEAGRSSSSTARIEVSEPEEPTPEPTEEPTPEPTEEPGDLPLEGETWTLAGTQQGVTITLLLEDGAVIGSAGCNTYSGRYTANNGQITISGLSSSQQICEDDVMAAEAAFLQALPTATAYQVDGDSMTLTTAGGSLIFVSVVSVF